VEEGENPGFSEQKRRAVARRSQEGVFPQGKWVLLVGSFEKIPADDADDLVIIRRYATS
jgi:hypothetical protein